MEKSQGFITLPSYTKSKFFTGLMRTIMNSKGKKHKESITKEREALNEKEKR